MAVATTAPHSQTETTRVPSTLRPKRRPWLMLVSLLAMVVCAGAFTLIYLRADSRIQVLAMARPVVAGQTITSADLRVVRVVPDSGVRLVMADRSSQVTGRSAVVPLVEGALLTETQLGPALWPPADQAVVAVPVKAGRLASGATAGVKVLVIPVGKETDTRPTPAASSSSAPIRAVVVLVSGGVDGSGTSLVSLLVARGDAVAVAGASGEWSIAVAQG